MKAQIIYDMPEREYHSDPVKGSSLSASLAFVFATQRPLHASLRHPHMSGKAQKPTKAMDMGAHLHSLVLGTGPELVVVDAADWKKKDAQTARIDARAAGKLAILTRERDERRDTAAVITARLAAWGRPLAGDSEVTIIWPVETSSGTIWARARLDHLTVDHDRGVVEIDDLKTTTDVSTPALTRAIARYDMGIQVAAYTQAAEAVFTDFFGRVEFRFMFAEVSTGEVRVGHIDGTMKHRGERLWREACESWGRCLQTGEWPGYLPDDELIFNSPNWLASQEMAMEHLIDE